MYRYIYSIVVCNCRENQSQLNLKTIYKSITATILLFVALTVNAQSKVDSTITADNFSKYLGLSCELRENLVKATQEKDLLTVNRLMRTVISFQPCPECQEWETPLYTRREGELLLFYTQTYEELLRNIRLEVDYFSTRRERLKGHNDPNFECGNLTTEMLAFWQRQTDFVIAELSESELNSEEKDLLNLYWKSILLYIEAENELSPNISEVASTFLREYPESNYFGFVQELNSMEKVYRPNGISLGFGIGKPILNGGISNYLKGDLAFDFEAGWTYRSWNLKFGGRIQSFNHQDSLRFNRIDDLVISESSAIEYNGATMEIGYTTLENNWLRLQPFVSGEINKFVNYIAIPDSTGIREEGSAHAALSFGTNVGLRIPNFSKAQFVEPVFGYYPREEKEEFYAPLFLNFKLGFYPDVFSKPIGIDGNSLYWTIGLEWIMGKNQAHYRIRK